MRRGCFYPPCNGRNVRVSARHRVFFSGVSERREPSFPNLHSLHPSVLLRTIEPPLTFPTTELLVHRRASLWDVAASAVRQALATLPAGSHVAVCTNSGPYNLKLEVLNPSAAVPGAGVGLLFAAKLRDSPKTEDVHPGWIQIATPINPTEGRLLAGLRIILAVIGREDLTFKITDLTYPTVVKKHMGLLRESEMRLKHGSVANSWKPTNLGCFYHEGEIWKEEEAVVRASFEWDGDL